MDGPGRHRTTDGPVGPGREGFLGVLSFLPDMHQTRDEQEEAAGCSLGKRPTGDEGEEPSHAAGGSAHPEPAKCICGGEK